MHRKFTPIAKTIPAGKITRIYFDSDFEHPLLLWVDGQCYAFSEEMADRMEPEVGDYLILPENSTPSCMSEYDFWQTYETAMETRN